MSLSPFFIVLLVALLVAVSAIVYFFITLKQQKGKLLDSGIFYLRNLRMLLMHVQQHRGLTTGYLNGNILIEETISQLEGSIQKEIADIAAIDDWIKNNAKWDSFLDHWSRLSNNYKTSNSEYNLKQHNVLIASLLYLIDDLAYTHQLNKLEKTDTDWRYLLSVAEYIGQARALGMGAVSRGECSRVLRVQLNHLSTKIEANINDSWPENTLQDLRYFLKIIEREVIIEKPTMSPADYFTLASNCIEHVLREFDRQIEKIQVHYQL